MGTRLLSFIDRRLLLYVAAACFGAAFLLAVVNTAADNRSSHRQVNELIEQNKQVIEKGDAERREASRERQRLLDSVDELDSKYQALLTYFRAQGYTIPEYVLRGQSADDSDDDGDTEIIVNSQEGSGKQSPPKSGSTAAADQPEPESDDKPARGSDKGNREERGRPDSPGRSESKPGPRS